MVPNTAPLRGIFDVHPVALRARGELPDTFAAPSFHSGQGLVQAPGTPAPSPCVSRLIIRFSRPDIFPLSGRVQVPPAAGIPLRYASGTMTLTVMRTL